MEATLIRLTRRYASPGGALYLPGEILSLPHDEAARVLATGAAEPATQIRSDKAPDSPPRDKMVAAAPRKKEHHG